jgi:heme/copper-type cytochrome/quinol oxidase subunit 3
MSLSGKQHAVLWLGLTLILMRLFTSGQWRDFYTLITTRIDRATSPQSGQKKTTAQTGSQGNGNARRSHG